MTANGVALGLLLSGASLAPAQVEAQGPEGRWPLQPVSEIGRVVAPFLEGWYSNPDGTFSYSFGYLNLNGDTIQIPRGEQNKIEPAQFDGLQPTVFLPGRHRGMFTVTVPAAMREDDVWWTITNPNGEVTRVPGRTMWSAYMLDHGPRPHGTVPPTVTFEGTPGQGYGPQGIVSQRALTGTVGTPVEVVVNVRDTSVRDRTDARFRDPIALRVIWTKHQGPTEGNVEFTRHPSTPVPVPPAGRGGRGSAAAADSIAAAAGTGGAAVPARPAAGQAGATAAAAGAQAAPAGGGGGGGGGGGRGGAPAGPHEIMVPSGEGTVRVLATFSAPGEYMLNAQVDNWRVPDSSSGDQCCWTNGYVRVTIR
ncbi:MAG: hypothetical protein ABL963_01380 [Longimicrobiales bacterium]